MPKTSPAITQELTRMLCEFVQDCGVWGSVFTHIRTSIGDDEESVVIRVDYGDGRWSETTFEGYIGISDLDDVLHVMVQELTENGADVVQRIKDARPSDVEMRLPGWRELKPFPRKSHQREGPTNVRWEGDWLPEGPYPSLKAP